MLQRSGQSEGAGAAPPWQVCVADVLKFTTLQREVQRAAPQAAPTSVQLPLSPGAGLAGRGRRCGRCDTPQQHAHPRCWQSWCTSCAGTKACTRRDNCRWPPAAAQQIRGVGAASFSAGGCLQATTGAGAVPASSSSQCASPAGLQQRQTWCQHRATSGQARREASLR